MAAINIAELTLDERWNLLEEIWASFAETPEAVPFPSEQREELERRLDDLDRSGPVGSSWQEVREKILRHR